MSLIQRRIAGVTMETERLHFKIGLSGSSSKKKPEFAISIDGTEHVKSTLTVGPNETEYFEFACNLDDEAEHFLEITFLNKLPGDTVVGSSGEIVEDLLLNIEHIEIDEIDLSKLKWELSSYYPNYPDSYLDEEQKKITEVKRCVNLGWNGTWKLSFKCPYYMWLLENL